MGAYIQHYDILYLAPACIERYLGLRGTTASLPGLETYLEQISQTRSELASGQPPRVLRSRARIMDSSPDLIRHAGHAPGNFSPGTTKPRLEGKNKKRRKRTFHFAFYYLGMYFVGFHSEQASPLPSLRYSATYYCKFSFATWLDRVQPVSNSSRIVTDLFHSVL
ncbi:hypothetical protein GGR53DRAFT_472790 [Hypoxylon sp. FL1150]|nr:hypothetical protein GGR53DRAFT_472790 [Hypoxylon sp. FL1150]